MTRLLYLIGIFVILTAGSCKKPAPQQEEPEEQPAEVDLALVKVEFPTLTANGYQINIRGTVQSYKDGVVTSMEIKWQVDDGAEHAHTFSGLNLNKLDAYEFVHPDAVVAETGQHTLKVWISDVNGQGEDSRTLNNKKTISFTVASHSVQRQVLYEEFTSSTCGPCANFNLNYFNTTFFDQNAGKFNLIKYQMSWPGSGDPYYTAEGGARRQYYGVNAVPTLFIDGEEGTYFDTNELQKDLNSHYEVPGVVNLTGYYTIDNNNDIKVKVVATPYISGPYKVHIAVVEKTTTQNARGNGESEFHHVMMKMVPDAQGTAVDMTDGTQFVVKKTASLNNTHIEEYSDLEVVIFIQDEASKFILQSAAAVEDASQIDF